MKNAEQVLTEIRKLIMSIPEPSDYERQNRVVMDLDDALTEINKMIATYQNEATREGQDEN